MKKILLTVFIASLTIGLSFAQRPKMHLKAKLGVHYLSYIYKEDVIESDYFAGLHGGFGFRVMHKRKFGEISFDFVRNYLYIEDSTLGEMEYKLNTFELPITMGYITVKKAVFKHFLYGGIVTEFKVKSQLTLSDFPDIEPVFIKPKEVNLRNPNFHMRFGTQFDLAMFNIDIHYSLGLNKTFLENFRTQSHSLRFTLGVIF